MGAQRPSGVPQGPHRGAGKRSHVPGSLGSGSGAGGAGGSGSLVRTDTTSFHLPVGSHGPSPHPAPSPWAPAACAWAHCPGTGLPITFVTRRHLDLGSSPVVRGVRGRAGTAAPMAGQDPGRGCQWPRWGEIAVSMRLSHKWAEGRGHRGL